MSPENMSNSNSMENPKEQQGVEPKKESSVLRNFLVGSVVAGAAMAPTLSEAQSYNTQSNQDTDIAHRAEVKKINSERHQLDIEKINKELKSKYPEASFEYESHGKCLNSFGGDVFYKGVMIGHVENNCGAGNGAILASGQSIKMLDNYLSRIGGTMVIKTSIEVEEKLKALKVSINGLKVQIFENRGGKIVWSNFEFDANTLSVDIVNNKKHPKGISIIMKNKDGTGDTVDIYPDSTGTANIVEGL